MTDTISLFCSVGDTVLAVVGFGVGVGVESHPAMTPIEIINTTFVLPPFSTFSYSNNELFRKDAWKIGFHLTTFSNGKE